MSQGSYGGFHLSVYYKTGQDQGLIRNKWVFQTQVCPLLVDIEMNRSSSNPGALLAHQKVKKVFPQCIDGVLGRCYQNKWHVIGIVRL